MWNFTGLLNRLMSQYKQFSHEIIILLLLSHDRHTAGQRPTSDYPPSTPLLV